jgi:urate oxidase
MPPKILTKTNKANMKLAQHQYGKAKVRVMKVGRAGTRHTLKELEVSVMLRGDFEASYTRADNRLVVATDTMKNIVNIIAKENLGAENEDFGVALGNYFLKTYAQVRHVGVDLSERCWDRIFCRGKPHAHSFIGKGAARPTASVSCSRSAFEVESGIEDLLILKTTGSGFEGYARDKCTTLPETRDRILATKLKANWSYETRPRRYSATNRKIIDAMLSIFAADYSPSVQTTLFQMGKAALRAAPEISKITLPNKHCLLVDLAPFGMENHNELFVPTDEPHGQIEGTVSRN